MMPGQVLHCGGRTLVMGRRYIDTIHSMQSQAFKTDAITSVSQYYEYRTKSREQA